MSKQLKRHGVCVKNADRCAKLTKKRLASAAAASFVCFCVRMAQLNAFSGEWGCVRVKATFQVPRRNAIREASRSRVFNKRRQCSNGRPCPPSRDRLLFCVCWDVGRLFPRSSDVPHRRSRFVCRVDELSVVLRSTWPAQDLTPWVSPFFSSALPYKLSAE